MISKQEALKAFPSTYFRKYQREVTEKVVDAFNSGVKVILLDAPTGFGKSIVNTTFSKLMKSFYATPQLTLVDQIKADKNIGKNFVEIKGRQNYFCTYDPVATVDIGVCKRVHAFGCHKLSVCPYWRRKLVALEANAVLMSFAYFLLEGRTDSPYSFGKRKLLVLDESHSLDKYVIDHVSLTVSPYSLPFGFYEKIRHLLVADPKELSKVRATIDAILEAAKSKYTEYQQTTLIGKELSLTETIDLTKVENFIMDAERFLESSEESEWVWMTGWSSYKGKNYRRLICQPLYARKFAQEMVWSRADLFIVSSATILDPQCFIFETGLDKAFEGSEILHLIVPSTFPPENRPIIDVLNGKLTYKLKDENLPEAVKILEKILDIEKGKNIAVHCHSYEMAIAIENLINPSYKDRLVTQTSATREEALARWKESRGKVFLCVAFTEGQDWVGDICSAQVLFKVPYADLKDKRVERRLQLHDWKWYRYEALKESIQAYGRAVRTPTDKARFYVIDASFVDLLRRTKKAVPEWFAEALPEHWKILVK